MIWAPVAAVAVLAAAHLGAGWLDLDRRLPRSKWLSIAGGFAVAFAILHLLPELAAAQEQLQHVERLAYAAALAGLVTFYGLESLVCNFRGDKRAPKERFWVHIGSFAVYNGVIAHLVTQREEVWVFTLAMALHMLVADAFLRESDPGLYQKAGRWVVVSGLAVGLVLGLVYPLPSQWFHVLTAFLVGGVILNIMKEELPSERKSSFTAFLGGAVGMSAVLWFV